MDSGNKNGITKTSNQGLSFEERTANALRGEIHHFLPWLTGSTGLNQVTVGYIET